MTNLTVKENLIYSLLAAFKQHLIVSEGKKESTTATYGVSIRQYLSYFGDNWLTPSKESCEEYKIYLMGKYKAGTVRTKLAAIKKLFKYLKNVKEAIAHNPWEFIVCGKNEADSLIKKVNFAEGQIVNFIRSVKDNRFRLLFALLYQSAGRISEILNLKWSDINGNIISITKSKTKKRDIEINPNLIADLQVLRGDSEYVFSTKNGTQLRREYVHNTLKKYCEKLNFNCDFSCHWFRHNAITNAARKGANPEFINKLGGWSEGSAMWQRYQNTVNIPNTSDYLSY
jgi:integrase/recombinase XerD